MHVGHQYLCDIISRTCVETNSYIQNIDSITDIVQHQPHQHIPHLQLIKTGPKEISILSNRRQSFPCVCLG